MNMDGAAGGGGELLDLVQNQVAVFLAFPVDFLNLFGEFFEVVIGGIVAGGGGRIDLVAEIAAFPDPVFLAPPRSFAEKTYINEIIDHVKKIEAAE